MTRRRARPCPTCGGPVHAVHLDPPRVASPHPRHRRDLRHLLAYWCPRCTVYVDRDQRHT
jgi:endogenous inhibitor of DNA gyrase (YacG/DUF329 family)